MLDYHYIKPGVYQLLGPRADASGYWCTLNHTSPIWNPNRSDGERSCCSICGRKPKSDP